MMSLVVPAREVVTVQVPAEALVAHEKTPAAEPPHAATEGLAAEPAAEQFADDVYLLTCRVALPADRLPPASARLPVLVRFATLPPPLT
jgi:hypothetical protein